MTTTLHRGDAAPGYLLYLTEPVRAAFDYTLLTYAMPLLAALPRGDEHPILVLPRLHGGDASTRTLRTVLKPSAPVGRHWLPPSVVLTTPLDVAA